MVVNEIFYSIQGESRFAGLPCLFIRLSGCNLRCHWCDTPYAFSEGEAMSFEQIFAALAAYPRCGLVEVTGGEPLLQPAAPRLLAELQDRGYRVLLETSGSLDLAKVPRDVVTIMDLKAPGSGEGAANRWENLDSLDHDDEIKIVLRDRSDYEWARSIIDRHHLAQRFHVALSPVHGVLPAAELSRWILEDGLDVRLNLQVHKLIWGADVRGV
ncbi:MAG: radical SAM protein [Candidatus Schekmanbacteria bacterium]|nr:radical SAM protein [Candidatus Schekmanbacteria bacterium]